MLCPKCLCTLNFQKKILSKKRKVNEQETIAFGEVCSVVILNKLPIKLKNPGCFSIPCLIGTTLCELVQV